MGINPGLLPKCRPVFADLDAHLTLRFDVRWVVPSKVARLDFEIPEVRFETGLVED